MSALENDHNVYVVGAGFSADRGLPVLANFMLVMRDAHPWLMTNGRKSEALSIQTVLEYRLKAASAGYRVRIELENIEELFSLAAASRDDLTPDIRTAIAATLDYCQKTNPEARTYFDVATDTLPTVGNITAGSFNPSRGNVIRLSMPTYEHYVGGLTGWFGSGIVVGKNTFISFNYDTLVEESLSGLGIDFTYGFKPNSVDLDPSLSSLRQREGASIKVLKLHGSNNWAREDAEKKLRLFGSYDAVRSKNWSPELVPPTWRKVFGNELNDVWSEALTAIESATRVIMLGFSMPETDLHFKYLLAAGLQNNVSLRQIVAVNPDTVAIEKRLSTMLLASPVGFKRWFVSGNTVQAFINRGFFEAGIESYGRSMHASVQSFSINS